MILASSLLLRLLAPAQAATLVVDPSDSSAYPTLTGALAAAADGDTVDLAPGTYAECVTVSGIAVTVDGHGAASLLGDGACESVVTVSDGGSVTALGLTVENHAGRAFLVTAAELVLDEVTVSGSGRSDLSGGAIWAESATITTSQCTFDDNQGTYGGAVYLSSGVALTDEASTWSGNVTGNHGGAIFAYTDDDLVFQGSVFRDNAAPANGGGAILGQWYTTLRIEGATFEHNTAASSGGAIFLYALYGTPEIHDTTFTGNSAGGSGGAIETEWNNDLTITGSTFEGNAAGSYGGAVAIWYDSHGVVSDTVFTDNTTYGAYGGGLFLYPQETSLYDLTVTGSTFDGNVAAYDGGGLWTGWVRDARVSDSVFTHNTSGATGGGMLIYVADTATLTRSTYCGNTATWGGGASVQWTGADTWENDVFALNSATDGGGATRYATYAGSMRNLTFAGNTASEWGGAYQAAWAYADFRNNLVTHSPDGNGIYASEINTYANTPIQYDGWYGNSRIDAGGYFWVDDGVDGNVVADPGYAAFDLTAGCDALDLRLHGASPARDAGDPTLLDPDGTRSDMGAWGGPGALVEDHDADGFDTTSDCDDTTTATHPGAPEVPDDGVDQDCDGADEVTHSGDSGDTSGDTPGDTSTDTAGDTSTDTSADTSGDTATDTDSGGDQLPEGDDTATGDLKGSGCGCATGPEDSTGGALLGGLALAALLVGRRRDT